MKARDRPIRSDIVPQNRRPAPLNSEIRQTAMAPSAGPTCVNSCASGAATEISAAPAVTLSASIDQSRYQCGVRSAALSVSSVAGIDRCCAVGVQPGGA